MIGSLASLTIFKSLICLVYAFILTQVQVVFYQSYFIFTRVRPVILPAKILEKAKGKSVKLIC